MSDTTHGKGGKVGEMAKKNPEQGDSQPEPLKADVTVLRASKLPNLKTMRGENRRFYITIRDASVKKEKGKETKAIRSAENTVYWNEKLDGLTINLSSHLDLSLYAEHRIRDIHIGTIELDPKSITDASFTIASGTIIVLTIHVHATAVVLEGSSVLENNPSHPSKISRRVDSRKSITDAKEALINADDAMKMLNVRDEWKKTVENVEWVMLTIKHVAYMHPYAKAAWLVISIIPATFFAQFERDKNVRALVKAMRTTFDLTRAEDLLKAMQPNSNQALVLKVMLKHIMICNDVIQRYAKDKDFSKRLVSNITNSISADIQRLCNTLQKLRQEFLDNAIITMQLAVHSIQESMKILSIDSKNNALDATINDLPYKSGWGSTANKNGCLAGTRADFLEYILEWIKTPTSVRGLILFGKAGTGKSSIAYEIASRFCFEDHPCSYFSFARSQQFEDSKQKDHHLFTTIIRDMSDLNPSFKTALGNLIVNNTPLRTSDDFSLLFKTLLLQPLKKANDIKIPELIVIDALDESRDPVRLAAFLSQSLHQLPSNFRIFITSRSEVDIEVCFPNAQKGSYEIHQMAEPRLADKIEDDIRLYFQTYLPTDMFTRYGKALVKKAEGLFQWAAIACGYINNPPPGLTQKQCLQGLLEGDKLYAQELQSTKLYKLYEEVLSQYFNTDLSRLRFRSVIGHLFGAFESLSINTLVGLRQFVPGDGRDEESVLAVVKFMGSLLSHVTSSNRDLPVVPLHTSFRDFLTDVTNKHPLSLDLVASHKEFTHACLDLMLHDLKFNICKLESSHLPNIKVSDLQSRVAKFISPPLFYACRFWDDHLECIPFDKAILHKLDQLFSKKFLFWLEVLSVTETIPLAVQAMAILVKWLKPGLHTAEAEVAGKVKTFIAVVTDAQTFLRCFGKVIATSAPHIYISALPFAPKSSEVFKTYSSKFPPTLRFARGQLDHWSALEMSIITHSQVKCVAFSSNSQWIAAGLTDGTIHLWDATTGMLEGNPFTGHSGEVRSLAFSPDGQHVISGSVDRTICLWNTATGMMVGKQRGDNAFSVNSVAFSRDGRRVISGSGDHKVRLWNVMKGRIEGNPIMIIGHTAKVCSVAFSPLDNECIVSGSSDGTIRVWKVVKGVVEGTPLILRTSSEVRSVAFSPDGRQIVSGCHDNTIRIWDSATGMMQGTPLKEHIFPVNSVKFSPDGQHIISGSGDWRICLWNATTKTLEGSPIIAHTQSVRSVAFSPDGQRFVSAADDNKIQVWNAVAAKRFALEDTVKTVTGHLGSVISVAFSPVDEHQLASCSDDHTICLWNIGTKRIKGAPLRGHTAVIHSVVFSPNGRQLASASADHTICLWNVATGTIEGSPLTGHHNEVFSIAFSEDGQRIVSGSSDHTIRVWNTVTRMAEGNPFTGNTRSVYSVAFSPGKGRRVVSGLSDGSIRLWDVAKGIMVGKPLTGHTARVVFVAFSSDGKRIISASQDKSVRLWNVGTEKVEGVPLKLHNTCKVQAFSLSSEGSRIAVGFSDSTIGIWNLDKRDIEGPLWKGHTSHTSCLAFSPSGRLLASGSSDSSIRVWDLSLHMNTSDDKPIDIDLSTIDDEGWIHGRKDELLLWIPHAYRLTLQRPKNMVAVFASRQTRLDFSKFVHGKDWATRYKST